MGLEGLGEWCSWELRNVSAVEKEKATGSNDCWGLYLRNVIYKSII